MSPAPIARRRRRHRGPDPDRPAHRPADSDPADPGVVAAQDRLDVLFDRLARVQLQIVVVDPPDARRLAARDRATSAAIVGGRHALLDEATAGAREIALRGYARSGFSGTWALTDMAMSVATPAYRFAAASVLEEAAMAAVVEDLVDGETLRVLRSTVDRLADLTGLPPPGSLSGFGSATGSMRRPVRIIVIVILALILLAFATGRSLRLG